MALEEKDIMQHRIVSEKIQVLGSLLHSHVLSENSQDKVEQLLVEMILNDFKYESK